MQFIYVLPGWEGSAADGRILRDAIIRTNGLVVPHDENIYIAPNPQAAAVDDSPSFKTSQDDALRNKASLTSEVQRLREELLFEFVYILIVGKHIKVQGKSGTSP